MNRKQAIELTQKIRDIRANRIQRDDGELSFHTLLRLSEMDYPKRRDIMERLVREGYAPSVGAIERMLNVKEVTRNMQVGSYCPSAGMSDDILDQGPQYIGMSHELLDQMPEP